MNYENSTHSGLFYKESANLLEKIAFREQLLNYLKEAKPEKIREMQMLITGLDEYIERTELILEREQNLYNTRRAYYAQIDKHSELTDDIETTLIKLVAQKKPDKLPELIERLTGKKLH